MTTWTPNLEASKGPRYLALANALERDVAAGKLLPGTRLPPHRDLADLLGINVSTVTRGYREARRRGLITGTVGRGTYVSSDAHISSSLVATDRPPSGALELGLVTPLYGHEPDLEAQLRGLLKDSQVQSLMHYTHPRGLPGHRAVGADWVSRYGLSPSVDEVVVCAGAQHALNCVLMSLVGVGGRLAVGTLTFPGIKNLAQMLGIELVPVDIDREGMIPEALDRACRRGRVDAVYVMPGCDNPTTARMGAQRRDRLAATIDAHKLLLIEDEAYGLICPDPHLPISNRVFSQSVFIAGLSKVLGPGLRTTFVAAPETTCHRLARGVLNTVWMAPPLSAQLACRMIGDGTADRVLDAKRHESRARIRLARKHLPGLDFSAQDEGYFIWLRLPELWTGQACEARLLERGVSVFGAERFAVGGAVAPKALRVALSGPADRASLKQGLDTVRDVILSGADSAGTAQRPKRADIAAHKGE